MKTKKTDLVSRSNDLFSQMVSWRRDFHRNPELSFYEKKTSEKIERILKDNGRFHIESGIGGHGIIATLSNGEGPTIGIRADMDALPVLEKNKHEWASEKPGVMHACGHDAHMAILLGVSQLLAEDAEAKRFQGTVKIIFQPAEECCDECGETGAIKMLQTGKLDTLDAVLALHMCPWRKTGEIQWHDGPSMANNDEFHLKVKGTGGHAGYPHHVNDPVWMATYILQALYSLNGRKVDPLEVGTISVGQIHAGEANNVIPHEVDIKGTIRSYTDDVREMLLTEIHQVAKIVTALGGAYEIDITRGEPSLINDPFINKAVKKAAAGMKLYNEPFGMGSEDFSHFTRRYPGSMFFLGCGLDKERSLHQPDFDIDEAAMPYGVRVMTASVHHLLKARRS